MSRRAVKLAVKLTLTGSLAAAVLVSASAASPGFVVVHPARLPLSLTLPSSWQVTTRAAGTRFDAVAADGSARLVVTTGLYPGYPGTFQHFVETEAAAARAHYRSQDPKASVAIRTVPLSSGPALQIRVTLTHGLPLAIDLFSLLHDGVTYHFTYYTSPALIGAERSIFARSARSIRFK
jgi:hypothetical protein